MIKKFFTLALMACLALGAMAENDAVTVSTYGNATGNTTRTMTVALTNPTAYVAFQMDLQLPTGTSIDATKIVAKAPLINGGTTTIGGESQSTNFVLNSNQIDASTNTYRIIGYNLGNVAIGGAAGDVCLTLPLASTEGVAYDAAVTPSNVIFVQASDLAAATLTTNSESKLWGDVIVDKVIDVNDCQEVANKIAGKTVGTTSDMFAADIVNDDTVDVNDCQEIANKIAGK